MLTTALTHSAITNYLESQAHLRESEQTRQDEQTQFEPVKAEREEQRWAEDFSFHRSQAENVSKKWAEELELRIQEIALRREELALLRQRMQLHIRSNVSIRKFQSD